MFNMFQNYIIKKTFSLTLTKKNTEAMAKTIPTQMMMINGIPK